MEVNHLLYKVDNLKKSVEYYRGQGFSVEYGRGKNPYNALIYLPEGPYIELINNMNMSKTLEFLLRLLGKKKFVDGMRKQEKSKEGFIRLCFGCEDYEISNIYKIFRKYKIKFMKIKVKRLDTKGRKLYCDSIFPEDPTLPLVKTLYANEKELHKVEHRNNAKKVIEIEYGVSEKDQDLIEEVNSDSILKICKGHGIKRVIVEMEEHKKFEFK